VASGFRGCQNGDVGNRNPGDTDSCIHFNPLQFHRKVLRVQGPVAQWLSHSQFPVICYSNTLRIDYPLGMLPPIEQICWLTFVKAYVRGPLCRIPNQSTFDAIPIQPFVFGWAKCQSKYKWGNAGGYGPLCWLSLLSGDGDPRPPDTHFTHIYTDYIDGRNAWLVLYGCVFSSIRAIW